MTKKKEKKKNFFFSLSLSLTLSLSKISTEKLCVASAAVSLIVLFLIRPGAESIIAESAHKVFGMPLLAHCSDAAGAHRAVARGADLSGHLVVVSLAIGLALVLEERAICKGLVTVEAREVVRMPLFAECIDALTSDGLTAARAFRGKRSIKALFAERFSFASKKATVKRLETLAADKVFRMPLLAECCDAAVCDRLIAVCAPWAEKVFPATFAVGLSITLIKCSGPYWLLACGTCEVLWMPHLPHRIDTLPSNGLPAPPARPTHRTCSSSSSCWCRPTVVTIGSDIVHIFRKSIEKCINIICCTSTSYWCLLLLLLLE